MSELDRSNEMSLAVTFLIGLRESGKHLIQKRDMEASWDESGLDYLFDIKSRMKRTGYLPKNVKLPKGRLFDKISDETGYPKKGTRIKKNDILLVHSAYFHYMFHRFREKALAVDFEQSDIDNLDRLSMAYWLCQAFARPGRGVQKILRHFKENAISLNQVRTVTSIRKFNKKKHVNIAVRTAAAIVILDKMLASYAK